MKDYHTYRSCIEACLKCAALCNQCASSCLEKEDVKMMADCIRLDMECAAACYATAQLLSLGSPKSRDLALICAGICEACAAECGKHDNDHCRECANACNDCLAQCRAL